METFSHTQNIHNCEVWFFWEDRDFGRPSKENQSGDGTMELIAKFFCLKTLFPN